MKIGSLTESSMGQVLKCLAAKHGSNDDEIVAAFARPGRAGAVPHLLEVQRPFDRCVLQCGHNPYFTARVVEDRLRYRLPLAGLFLGGIADGVDPRFAPTRLRKQRVTGIRSVKYMKYDKPDKA